MRAVVQRVLKSSVSVDGKVVGQIGKGFNILLGVGEGDGEKQVEWLAEKIAHLRIFEDENGKMNLALNDVGGAALVISQFTLYGDCEKGRRPSFTKAAHPKTAKQLYEDFTKALASFGIPVETGIFQTDMKVEILNDGPVTMIIDTPNAIVGKTIEQPVSASHLGLTDKEQTRFDKEAQMVRRNLALRKAQQSKSEQGNKNG